jgi:predicted  nucleic acid-binding Zn-ribbon protein
VGSLEARNSVIAATPAEQRRLHDLQQVDTAVRQLEHRRANLPEQKALDENAQLLAKVADEYGTSREQLDRLARQQKWHEDEIATVDARRKGEEARMYSGRITSERELEALRSELSSLRGRKSDLEDALLEIMEQHEELESVVATLKERHAQLRGAVAELTTARDAAAADIDAELAVRAEEREKVASDVPPTVLAFYDELRGRKDGVAVAELRGSTCMGCRLQLTAIELEDVRAAVAEGLARCEQCGRILVLSDSASEVHPQAVSPEGRHLERKPPGV